MDAREVASEDRGEVLLALLRDVSPEVRSAAAVRIGQLLCDGAAPFAPLSEIFETLRLRDSDFPGVADAFWTTVAFEGLLDDSFDSAALKRWMLAVLGARQKWRDLLSPVPGNDLEFYAHELFDDDRAALEQLLAWGYDDVVAQALDHPGALAKEHVVELLKTLFARTKDLAYAEWLATSHGVVLPEARAKWQAVTLVNRRAAHLVRQYAYRRLWTVQWLFFEAPFPKRSTLVGNDDSLLDALRAAGLEIDPYEKALDPKAIGHIGFPDVPGTERVVLHPRADLQIDLAVTDSDAISSLRIVRGRHPIEVPGSG